MSGRASQAAIEALRGPSGSLSSQVSIEVLRAGSGAVVSQAAVEVLSAISGAIASQTAVEVLRAVSSGSGAMVSQAAFEILSATAGGMVSQAAVEVLRAGSGGIVSQAAVEVLRSSQEGTHLSQLSIEVLRSEEHGTRLSQLSMEVLRNTHGGGRASQVSIEVLRNSASGPRVTQVAIEILRANAEDAYALETVTPWPFRPNALYETVERYGYLSEVLRARNGTEQRRLLRETAGGGVGFTCTFLTLPELQYASTLLRTLIGQKIGVPLWQYAQELSVGCAAGVTEIPADTAGVPFYAAAPAMLWKDPWIWEIVWVNSVGPASLSLVNALVGSWAALETILVPLVFGYLEEREELLRHGISAGDTAFDFDVPAFFP